jgi:hypothetical protein
MKDFQGARSLLAAHGNQESAFSLHFSFRINLGSNHSPPLSMHKSSISNRAAAIQARKIINSMSDD